LMERETIKTTPARAKELRWYAERAVTLLKRGDVASRRKLVRLLGSTQNTGSNGNRVRLAIENLQKSIVPRFMDRQGGYTQILRIAKRRAGDNAELCVMRYLPADEDTKKAKGGDKKANKSKKNVEVSEHSEKSAKAAKAKAEKTVDKSPQDKVGKVSKKKDKE
jgi:large subunit ribosomal protein L17